METKWESNPYKKIDSNYKFKLSPNCLKSLLNPDWSNKNIKEISISGNEKCDSKSLNEFISKNKSITHLMTQDRDRTFDVSESIEYNTSLIKINSYHPKVLSILLRNQEILSMNQHFPRAISKVCIFNLTFHIK